MGQTSKLKYICEFDCGKAMNNAKEFAGKLEKLSKDAVKAGAALTVALTPFMYISKKATQQADEYARSVAKIRVATGETGAALNALVDNFKEIRKAVPQGDELVAQTLGAVNQKFSVTGKTLETVTKAMLDFSRMTGTDATNSVTAVAKAMNNWKIQAKDTTAFLDKVYMASTKTGASAESIATYMASMGAQFRNLNLTLDQSIALVSAFQKAGISVNSIAFPMTKAIGEMSKAGIKDIGAGFADLIKKIKEAGSAAEANAIGKKFFGGRGYMQITTAIREGRFEIDELIKSLQNSGGSFNKAAEDSMTFGEKLTRFKENAANALEPLGQSLIKIAEEYMPKMQKAIEGFAERLNADKVKTIAYSGAIIGVGLAATKAVTGVAKLIKAVKELETVFAASAGLKALFGIGGKVALGFGVGYGAGKIIQSGRQKQATQDEMLKAIRAKEPNWGNYSFNTSKTAKKRETIEEAYKRLFPQKQSWTYDPSKDTANVTSGTTGNFLTGTGATDFSKIGAKSSKSTVDYANKITKLKDEIDRLNNTSNYNAIIAEMDKYAAKLSELDNLSSASNKKNYEAWQNKKEYTSKFTQELNAAISDVNLALEKNDITIEQAYSSISKLGERYKLSASDAYIVQKALRNLRDEMNANTQSIIDLDRQAAIFSQQNMLNKWANQYNAETAFGGAASIKTAQAYLSLLEQTWASLERGSSAWVEMGEKIREVQNASLGVNLGLINTELNVTSNYVKSLTGQFAVGFTDAIANACKGTADFKDSIISLLQEMGAMVVKATLLSGIMSIFTGKPMFGAGGTFFKALGFHSGGVVGQSSPTFTRITPIDTFAHAPRLHTGNLRADEYPAILQKGETVIPKNQHFGNATESAGTENHYNITIQAVDSKSFTDMLTRNNGGIESLIVNSLNRGGALRSAIRGATA